jgi:hypothetical protein
MGAGVPQATINRRIRQNIQYNFGRFGGERLVGKAANTTASGVYKGRAWTLGYRVLRASNGEVALLPKITIDGSEIDSNGFTSLEKELEIILMRVGRSV